MADNIRQVKGVPYKIVGDSILIHPDTDQQTVIPLELGKSAYATVYSFINRKEGRGKRNADGTLNVHNFSYKIEENVVTVYRKTGDILGSFELDTESKQRYVRNAVTAFILSTLE